MFPGRKITKLLSLKLPMNENQTGGGVKQLVSDIMTVSTVVVHFRFLDFAVSTFGVLTAIRGGVL